MSMQIAVQLYTVREDLKKDYLGVLERVAEIGYTGVEFFGGVFGGMKASELKSNLDRLGLKAVASHTDVTALKENLDEVIEYNLEIGNKNIVVPYAKYNTLEDYMDMARFCTETGEKCKNKGAQLFYHNHAHEFEKFDGKHGLDIIFNESNPELLMAEIDTYWVTHAGVNPVDYIKKYAGRCDLIHLKDMEVGEEKHYAEVGEGIMDIRSIITTAKECGAKHFVVEQDVCKRPALESIKISYDNLKKMNLL